MTTAPPNDYDSPGRPPGSRSRLEGEIQSLGDGVLVLALRNGRTVTVREEDVIALEVHKGGSTGMKAVGALLGIPAGLIAGGLVCATVEDCSLGAVWVSVVGGAVLGATATGSGHWQTVPIVRQRRVSLALQPVRRGAGVSLGFRF